MPKINKNKIKLILTTCLLNACAHTVTSTTETLTNSDIDNEFNYNQIFKPKLNSTYSSSVEMLSDETYYQYRREISQNIFNKTKHQIPNKCIDYLYVKKVVSCDLIYLTSDLFVDGTVFLGTYIASLSFNGKAQYLDPSKNLSFLFQFPIFYFAKRLNAEMSDYELISAEYSALPISFHVGYSLNPEQSKENSNSFLTAISFGYMGSNYYAGLGVGYQFNSFNFGSDDWFIFLPISVNLATSLFGN